MHLNLILMIFIGFLFLCLFFISKETILFNEELFIICSFFFFTGLMFFSLRTFTSSYLDFQINEITKIFSSEIYRKLSGLDQFLLTVFSSFLGVNVLIFFVSFFFGLHIKKELTFTGSFWFFNRFLVNFESNDVATISSV